MAREKRYQAEALAVVSDLRLVLIVGVVCAGLFGGCRWFKKDVDKEIGKTPSELKKEKLLKKVDRKYRDSEAHYELGRLYQADGMWMRAESEYNVALSFDPVHKKSQAGRIKVLIESGDSAKAALLKDIYMEQASTVASESLRLGLAFQEQLLDEYAFDAYKQALRLAPNSAKINRQVGYYHLSKNNKEMAKEYLSRSFQLNPNQPEVAGELGRMGVAVSIPRQKKESTRKLDKIVEKSDKEIGQ